MVVRRGEVYENPVCGERVVIRVGNDESAGERILWDLYLESGGAVVGEHYHPSSDERFTLVRGRLGLRVAGREEVIEQVGQSVLATAGTRHYFWNADNTEARVLVEMRGAAKRFELMVFRQLFNLAQDGKTNTKGMPNLLQAAVTSLEFADVARFTTPSWARQRLLFGLIAPLARALGYRGLYPRYQDRPASAVTEPEPLPPEVLVRE
ncbi:MAG: cupin domain-containing protein [Pseudonocardiaceae bacterium]